MVTPRKRGCGSHWTDDHIEHLKRWYGKMPINTLSKVLTRRRSAVQQMARKLGLSKRRYRVNEIDQARYEKFMALTAVFSGVQPRHMFRDLRQHERELSAIKFAAWASLRDEGVSCASIARAAGVDHTSVLYGTRRHAEMAAREAAE